MRVSTIFKGFGTSDWKHGQRSEEECGLGGRGGQNGCIAELQDIRLRSATQLDVAEPRCSWSGLVIGQPRIYEYRS